MRVFNKYILCKSAQDTHITTHGAYAGLQYEKPIILEIVLVGDSVTLPIEKGDKIIVLKYSGVEIEIGDNEYTIIREDDVVAKLEKGDVNE